MQYAHNWKAFQDKYPINPSFEIARTLSEAFSSRADREPAIRIILHQSPIKVVYEHVQELIPRLLAAYQGQIDAVLHIGMASGRKFYTIEKFARRDGYTRHKDLDGKVLAEEYGPEHFPDCPSKMTTTLDYQLLWEDWFNHISLADKQESSLKREELCQSEDAGNFLCDFTYFNSLAFYARREHSNGNTTSRPVMFLHVPGESDVDSLKRGSIVAVALVRAIADQISC
ncbi:hypothetical protein AMS68_001551 [Peltaster fructicola]|uniref:Peptidase C15, pyroglutamyl peptidase I-like protein n=1 Tax=Peltaster fructicola TaxID=286661 RepID=A0A6H0XMT0_9PEZI|nr:hypothetical protein AMS68_001551 [Peltaster fructicola]